MNLRAYNLDRNLKIRLGNMTPWLALASFMAFVYVGAYAPGSSKFEQKKGAAWALVEDCYRHVPKSPNSSIDATVATLTCNEQERVFQETYGTRPAGSR